MDKYTQVKRIGEGSFGKALLVKAKDSGKYFVIKEINIQKVRGFCWFAMLPFAYLFRWVEKKERTLEKKYV